MGRIKYGNNDKNDRIIMGIVKRPSKTYGPVTEIPNKNSKAKSLIGLSRSIDKLRQDIPLMAKFVSEKSTMNSILVTGHSGVGKTVLIDLILEECKRKHSRDWMVFDCSAIEPNLIRGELFGYLKGAFTGATQDRTGLLKEASGKILFLDEIGNISQDVQKALLLALEGRQIIPIGGSYADTGYRANFGLITATNKSIRDSADFAKELYHRIALWQVNIPSLTERKIDIIPLICDILQKHKIISSPRNVACWKLVNLYMLMDFDWKTGGYRELEQEILYLSRNGKLSWQFQCDYERQFNKHLLVDKGMNYRDYISRYGEPDRSDFAAPNMVNLHYSLCSGRRIYKINFRNDLLEYHVLTRHFSHLQWPEQSVRITSQSLYGYLKDIEISLHPEKILELLIRECQYYVDTHPEDYEDPGESLNLDLFFMGLICPYQKFNPSKYIPYTALRKLSDKISDSTPDAQHTMEYEFPIEPANLHKSETESFKPIADENDCKIMKQLLTKYNLETLTDDFKKLIIKQKALNHLTWEDVRRIYGIDRRSLLAVRRNNKA
jgi:hypothetical protein